MPDEPKHTPFHKALCRAYSAGWISGWHQEPSSELKTLTITYDIIEQFPAENAAAELLEACGCFDKHIASFDQIARQRQVKDKENTSILITVGEFRKLLAALAKATEREATI